MFRLHTSIWSDWNKMPVVYTPESVHFSYFWNIMIKLELSPSFSVRVVSLWLRISPQPSAPSRHQFLKQWPPETNQYIIKRARWLKLLCSRLQRRFGGSDVHNGGCYYIAVMKRIWGRESLVVSMLLKWYFHTRFVWVSICYTSVGSIQRKIICCSWHSRGITYGCRYIIFSSNGLD